MKFSFFKYGAALVLSVACIALWYVVLNHARDEKTDISVQFQSFKEELLLPTRIAALGVEPRDTALVMPVEGILPEQIADTWGAARVGGRTHEGTDIFGYEGMPIFSATEGYVYRIGENNLGGNYIFIFARGSVRYYYAHLYAVNPVLALGDKVSTTTFLGWMGNTGNASSTPHHLHFGMYTRSGVKNPYPYLAPRES
jgi:murein DD-endopeptidase MepM/ murein hydrolase activator NlpD